MGDGVVAIPSLLLSLGITPNKLWWRAHTVASALSVSCLLTNSVNILDPRCAIIFKSETLSYWRMERYTLSMRRVVVLVSNQFFTLSGKTFHSPIFLFPSPRISFTRCFKEL